MKKISTFDKFNENNFFVWFQYGSAEEGIENIGTFDAKDENEAIDKGLKEYLKKNSILQADNNFIKSCLHAKKT